MFEALGIINWRSFTAPTITGNINTKPITGNRDLIFDLIGPERGIGSDMEFTVSV